MLHKDSMQYRTQNTFTNFPSAILRPASLKTPKQRARKHILKLTCLWQHKSIIHNHKWLWRHQNTTTSVHLYPPIFPFTDFLVLFFPSSSRCFAEGETLPNITNICMYHSVKSAENGISTIVCTTVKHHTK